MCSREKNEDKSRIKFLTMSSVFISIHQPSMVCRDAGAESGFVPGGGAGPGALDSSTFLTLPASGHGKPAVPQILEGRRVVVVVGEVVFFFTFQNTSWPKLCPRGQV